MTAALAHFAKLCSKYCCWNMISMNKRAEQPIILLSILWTIADLENHLLPWILGATAPSSNDQQRRAAVFLAMQFGKPPVCTVVRGGSCYVGCFQEEDKNTLLCDHSWEWNQGLKRSNPDRELLNTYNLVNNSNYGVIVTISVPQRLYATQYPHGILSHE